MVKKDPVNNRSTFKNIRISGGVNGIVGSAQDTDFDNIHISNVDNPIDLDRFDRSTMSRLKIDQKAVEVPESAKEPRPTRKYFGGFSFSKGDHLKKD